MIDFHCHIDLCPNPESTVSSLEKSGAYVLSVTTTPRAFPKTSRLVADSKRIRTALGLHPQIAHLRSSEVDLFDHLLRETKYVGEIGLDGGKEYRKHSRVQTRVFESILTKCTTQGGRILSLHSRHAATEVLNALEKYPNSGIPILHWFTGTKLELQRAIKLGCWFSVGKPMLRSAKARELISLIPKDRILTETDAPFASGEGILESLEIAVQGLSALWNEPFKQVEFRLEENLKLLIKLSS